MPRGTSRYDEARLQGRLFDANNCATRPVTYINFNRRDSLTITSGLISSARNLGKGGNDFNSNTTVTTPGNFPPLSVLPNGTTVAAFATTDTLGQPTTSGLNNADPTQTVIYLARYKTGSNGRILQGGIGANFAMGFYSGSISTWYDSTGFRHNSGITATVGQFYLSSLRSTASYVPSLRTNGVDLTCTGTVGGAASPFAINVGNFSENSTCDVFAIAAWYGSLSDSDITKVEGAFAWEAGVQGSVLSASHPYRNRPPTIGG